MMPTPKTHRFQSILCVLDLSRASATALSYARAMAASSGAMLTALLAPGALRSAKGTADAEAGVIMRAARRLRADVVIMSTTAHDGRDPSFDSTTASVLRRYGGAVLVVPPHSRTPRGAWPGPSVAAAVSDDDRHRHAQIAAAARMAEHFGAWLSTVPVIPGDRRRRDRASLIIFALPRAGRARTRQQGSAAQRFICKAISPVLVVRTPGASGRKRPPARRAA